MNSELLQTFLKIVEYKQISQAADSLYITQAAVSNRLRRMESLSGVKLINRGKGNNTISLTKYGEKLVPIAQQWLQLNQQFNHLNKLADYHLIRVVASTDITTTILTPNCNRLLADDPLLHLSLSLTHNLDVYQRVADGVADVGFSFSDSARHGLETHRVGQERLVVIASPDSSYPDKLSADNLSRHDELFIPYNDEYANWHMLCWDAQESPLIQLDSSLLVGEFLQSPLNWAIIPESVAAYLLQHHVALRILKLLENPPLLPVIAVNRDAQKGSADLNRLIMTMKSTLFKDNHAHDSLLFH
ncbi:LysR family transcriptional regulator [Levilactobacillus zymae]|uniref:LysR family transcriptional regulator n=1 Tax=Levilactobacillus zymae TaxID=267363 RepID=UPI0028B5220A|nr:LysR family transcriptional regulator [Levilactobacillus zymae]MDT6981566.1 LysR family transcriptional regulator [Levilactobacillus zymae]